MHERTFIPEAALHKIQVGPIALGHSQAPSDTELAG